ncbi:MAG: succinate dehydrogenase, cytochrome b556 subunit [Gammaproteobacteria bacterium]|nr:succinate dehydrogenase, cytochrome b556 subunit [Gammaproteobacteria bacterium]
MKRHLEIRDGYGQELGDSTSKKSPLSRAKIPPALTAEQLQQALSSSGHVRLSAKPALRQRQRTVFLDLRKIRLPVAGVMSIAHRITGVAMVLLLPVFFYLLDLSLADEAGFLVVKALFVSDVGRFVLFFALWGLMHHLLAGVRYLLIDLEVGVDKPRYRQSAWLVLFLAPTVALLLLGGLL